MEISLPDEHKAVIFYPPSFNIRVEKVPIPQIEHEDDAIVKVILSGLCGSDLHIYRGTEGINAPAVCGHEFIGTVVALGSSFQKQVQGRPKLYSTLKIGDKVVSPFTVSCGECHFCQVGLSGRCTSNELFGTPSLPGAQAGYVRVPKAGGTLFSLEDPNNWPSLAISTIADSSLLFLSDNLPTGMFAAQQVLQHPKIQPFLAGKSYMAGYRQQGDYIKPEDQQLTLAVIGLGVVGICACISLLDILSKESLKYKIIAIDLNDSRREKLKQVYRIMQSTPIGDGELVVFSGDEGKRYVAESGDSFGCNAILEAVGHTSSMQLAYELVRPFGVITSIGVHQDIVLPFTGQQLYDKNISLDFGRCPVRTMFPPAFDLLVRRQEVFRSIGGPGDLVEKVVDLEEAPACYEEFNEGLTCGKILFKP